MRRLRPSCDHHIAHIESKDLDDVFPDKGKMQQYAQTHCNFNIEFQDSREGLAVADRRASRWR